MSSTVSGKDFLYFQYKIVIMKSIIILLSLLVGVLNALPAQQLPTFRPLRYDEDYSVLQKDSSSSNWYTRIKYSPLSANGSTYISFGGEFRMQYFYAKNDGWGDEPEDKDGYVLSRYLLHTDLHLGKHFRTFIQVQSSMANGKLSTSPVDEDPLDLHQAFAEYSTTLNSKTKVLFRFGRQELSYGSQRLVAVRDGPNNRQAFDGAKVSLTNTGYKIDLFYSHYVAAKKGIFDDGWNKSTRFWGSYMTINKMPVLGNVDVYYLGLWRSNANFDDGSGRELRHSIGTRIFGKQNALKYDIETLYQFGRLSNKHISAWTASANIAYEFVHVKYKPEIGFKTELISGDKRYGDDVSGTFNPMFPRGAYFGLAALIGPANLIDLHPSLSFELTPRLDWNMDYDIFWRYSLNDGIYAPNTSLMYSGESSKSRNIGQQLSTEFVYTPNPFLYFRAEFTWFKTAAYLKDVTAGKDILFAGVTAQVKF
jgi:hypothetical protein